MTLKTARALERKIRDRSARIGIIGLGYVGLPEAVMFAEAGFCVTGFDVDPERVEYVNALESTTHPGTPKRSCSRGCGLKAGADLHLAFSPERVTVTIPRPPSRR